MVLTAKDLFDGYLVEFPELTDSGDPIVTVVETDFVVVRRCRQHRALNDVGLEEYDVVCLVRAYPDCNVPAGAEGTVLELLTGGGVPPACTVEFPKSVGTTEPWVTIAAADLEVVWRPGFGRFPGFGPESS
jgi:hypothetical protein